MSRINRIICSMKSS